MDARGRRAGPAGLVAALGMALACAGGASAQETGTVFGAVLDARSLVPIVGARVELVGRGSWMETDDEGRFAFEEVGEGQVSLRVSRPGYGSVVERLSVTAEEIALVQFQLLPIDAVLDELLVQVRGNPAAGSSEATVGGDQLASMTAADLLAQKVPGLVVDRTSGAVGGGARVLIRGVSSLGGSNAPAIYLDGIRIDDRASPLRGSREPQAFHALEQIPASEVSRIRVLRGPAASARYEGAAHGVILIETRRGRGGAGG